ncbi:MAG TPA: protein kinase, partial [Polyangiaceae bacterium]|nr:protein kinase [Polyangiaceae bacterium]
MQDEFRGTDRYVVVRRIGAGGMGVVYEAHDRERGTRVALKTLRKLDPTALYRFKHEFRSLADVCHPNLVNLYELVSASSGWFFIMELIDGVNFLEWVRVGALATDDDADTETTTRPRMIPGIDDRPEAFREPMISQPTQSIAALNVALLAAKAKE